MGRRDRATGSIGPQMLRFTMNRLRSRVRRLERRWITDRVERERHEAIVRRMLHPPATRDDPPAEEPAAS